MQQLPETYDPEEIESKWQEYWLENDIFEYEDTGSPDYIVDTPPPYPTGNFHIGNALGWCYIDYAARFHRLIGDDVSFPQGWDCHGLPTEVKVEEIHDIHRTDVPRDEFREMCIDHTNEQIQAMKQTMIDLGFSQDWSQEFATMDPEYWGETQRSFTRLVDKGYVYRDEHPVNWCPRCETAIADAEVENMDRSGTLYHIRFPGVGNDDIEIATTRPELLPACVGLAIDPDDERYTDRVGDTFEVPIFGQEVELIGDEAVDQSFGTGAVMICTFGDKQDVTWWGDYNLELRPAISEDGHLTDIAGDYAGLEIEEAKAEIADDLTEAGYLTEAESVEQSVGVCWRCDTPIEILSKEQWFISVDKEEILETAQETEWIPSHMYDRLEDWTESMDWDWVISRQRVFATPIPAWFCDECDHIYIASEDELPVDPTETDPEIEACPECNGDSWRGENDVMDTWMDSSISPLMVADWPEENYEPVQLRVQGHDIIRTWAFYTILRTAALEETYPWESALIHGMVFGTDGRKMSKSRDNAVAPEEAVEEYSADAFRQALAIAGQPGSDVQFQWKEMKSASRFLTKLWNICRFGMDHFDEDTPDVTDPAYRATDNWILEELEDTTEAIKDDMEAYRFDRGLRRLREFIWNELADDYVELIKGRLYNGPPGERNAAKHTLYTVIKSITKLLAPFSPHITEEIWHKLPGTTGSVHQSNWPTFPVIDEDQATDGKIIADVASTVRAWKSEQGIPLNEPLERVEIYFDDSQIVDTYDLSETVNAPIQLKSGEPDAQLEPVEIEPNHEKIGPKYRDKAGDIVTALEQANPATIKSKQESGEISLSLNGESVTLDPDMIEIEEELRAPSGEPVAIEETDHATIVIVPNS
ncbi:MAG: valine--tRNA ligase [Halobacteriaceae archaeon]